MGDMSLMAQIEAIDEEGRCDEFVAGHMSQEDAYDYGLLDENGAETAGIQAAWERSAIPTEDNLHLELSAAEMGIILNNRMEAAKSSGLNKKALQNLLKESPTCNICDNSMEPRVGVFGKFYFCGGGCEGQRTVSDKYWQSVKH